MVAEWMASVRKDTYVRALLASFLNCQDLRAFDGAMKERSFRKVLLYFKRGMVAIARHRPTSVIGTAKYDKASALLLDGEAIYAQSKAI